MSGQYRTIHPVKYYRDYLAHKVRPDGRGLLKFRPVTVNLGTLGSADGSSVVKIGNTTVVCGIKLELTKPLPAEPNVGFLVPNVEFPPLCSSQFRPGPPGDQAQLASHFVSNIVSNSGCIDLRQLCIVPDKLVWVLFCDIVCINHDGAVHDASLTALMSALRTVTLPEVQFDADTGEKSIDVTKRKPLNISKIPASTTYALFEDDILLADPTNEEESLCSGTLSVVVQDGQLCSINKPGGNSLSEEDLQQCVHLAHKRAKSINVMIQTALGSPER